MINLRKFNPTMRAVGVISAVAILAGGVTFAALNSNNVTLADNTINSATASLKIWNGGAWSDTSAPGFHVTGLVPGTGVSNPLYLENDGGVALNLSAHVTGSPILSGFDNDLDLSKVKVSITDDFTGYTTNTDLAALTSGTVPFYDNAFPAGATGNSGVPGTDGNFTVKFDMDPSAVNSNSASVSSFNIVLSGQQP